MATRLLIEYDGTHFRGWARQPGLRTVQGELERALEVVRREPTALTVAGRTDTGVHALGQVASHAGTPVSARSINARLPHDVAVLVSEEVDDSFDARRDARARRYCYRVWTHNGRPALLRDRVLVHNYPVDRSALDACCEELEGEHDFEAFTLSDEPYVSYRRFVKDVRWVESSASEGNEVAPILEFWIEADSFTRRMVRSLVSYQLEIAAGRRSLADFRRLLKGAPRSEGGGTAPSAGLYLAAVRFE